VANSPKEGENFRFEYEYISVVILQIDIEICFSGNRNEMTNHGQARGEQNIKGCEALGFHQQVLQKKSRNYDRPPPEQRMGAPCTSQ
jgi:hypothetical protein